MENKSENSRTLLYILLGALFFVLIIAGVAGYFFYDNQTKEVEVTKTTVKKKTKDPIEGYSSTNYTERGKTVTPPKPANVPANVPPPNPIITK